MSASKRRDGTRQKKSPIGGLEQHQPDATASPAIPLKRPAGDEEPHITGGNFQDLQSLLDQLGSPPLFELGKPLLSQKFLPKQGLSSCPAAHNRALLDEMN